MFVLYARDQINLVLLQENAFMPLELTAPEHRQVKLRSLGSLGKTTTFMVLFKRRKDRIRVRGNKLKATK